MNPHTEKPDKPLTHKQEKFCHAILDGANQSDAYREAYSTDNKAAKTIHECASRLMTDRKVLARISEMRAPAVKRAQRSYEDWLLEIEDVAFVKTERLEVKTPDKLKALEVFGKATGFIQEKSAAPTSPLETASTAILLTMLDEIKQRQAAREVTLINPP